MSDDARLSIVLEAKIDKLQASLAQAGSSVTAYSSSAQRSLDALKAKIDPVGAASDKMTAAITFADKAFAAGKLTIEQHTAALELARHEYDALTESINKTSIAEAAEMVIARSRLAVFEEGAAKIPIYGAALEALGPIGLAAAAGVAAIAFAGEEARKAMDYAEDLERTSKALGVTTTYLQQFDYANVASGVSVEKGRDALTQFNEVLGKYSAGLAPGRVSKFFDAIGFTPEGVRNTGDVTVALGKALEGLAKVPNASQRAGIAAAQGLTPLLPVLAEGQEGIDKFLASMREAYSNGAVINPAEIAKAAELNDQVEALSKRIDQEFKSAFLSAAPAVLQVATYIERVTSAISGFLTQLPFFLKGLANLPGVKVPDGTGPIASQVMDFINKNITPANTLFSYATDPNGPVMKGINDVNNRGRAVTTREAVQAGLTNGVPELRQLGSHPGGDYTPPAKANAAPTDRTDEDTKKAAEELATQTRAAAEAQAALTTDILAHADFEKQAVAAELAKEQAKLSAEEKALQADVDSGKLSDADAAVLKAQLEAARALAVRTAGLKDQKIDQDAQNALATADLAQSKLINGFYDQILQNAAAMARTTAERRDAELDLLASQKKQADADRASKRDTDLRNAGTDAQRTNVQSKFDEAQASADDAYASNVKKTLKANQDALDAWKDDTLKNVAEVGDALQKEAVKGLDDFNDGIATAISQGQSLGDVMHTVFATMEADLIKYLLKQAEIGVLGGSSGGGFNLLSLFGLGGSSTAKPLDLDALVSSLPAHAGGSDSFGGLTTLNERGTEGVAFLPPNTQIIPNDVLRGLAKLNPAAMSSGAGASINTPITISVDARGSTPDSVAILSSRLDRLQAELPGTIAITVQSGFSSGRLVARRS